ncbi:MAG: hypothetical protein H7144_14615 [Burkholderiales bacterium]|nr:hypothetical protein [Phycisphaerae bacterium]
MSTLARNDFGAKGKFIHSLQSICLPYKNGPRGAARNVLIFLLLVNIKANVSERVLHSSSRGAWQLVAAQGSFAHPFSAAAWHAALKSGETRMTELKRSFRDEVRAFFLQNPGWE